MKVGQLVATSTSKWGGACAQCRLFIRRGEPIHKLATKGATTKHGQGPGIWVCATCATPAIEEKAIAKRDKQIEEAQETLFTTDIGEGDQGSGKGHWRN